MSYPYQQGHADGLCGLYSVLNFLMTLPDWKGEAPADAMEYVLQAAQAEGVLSPSKITKGYKSTEIKAILNRIFNQEWMPYRAYYLCELLLEPGEDILDLHVRVLEAKGAIIGGSDDRGHWLLFAVIADKRVIVDSSSPNHAKRAFDKRSRPLCSEDAVVVLPVTRSLMTISA